MPKDGPGLKVALPKLYSSLSGCDLLSLVLRMGEPNP